jgi:hypothetical protein
MSAPEAVTRGAPLQEPQLTSGSHFRKNEASNPIYPDVRFGSKADFSAHHFGASGTKFLTANGVSDSLVL